MKDHSNDTANSTLFSLQKIPAKSRPFQSISAHAHVTGLVAQTLFSRHLSTGTRERLTGALNIESSQAENTIGYLASLHDIGKLGDAFQECILHSCSDEIKAEMNSFHLRTASQRNAVRHEVTTKLILRKALWKVGRERTLRQSRDLLADILGAHHQGRSSSEHDYDEDSVWAPYWEEFDRQMQTFFLHGESFSVPLIDDKDKAFVGVVLNGLIILADWIASGTYFEDADHILQQADGVQIILGRTEEFVSNSELAGSAFNLGDSFDAVLPEFAGRARPLQQITEEIFQTEKDRISLLLIEAPMGEGKTEAALYSAAQMAKTWKKNGIYFALPTAATANQMVKRVQTFLEKAELQHHVRLLHSMAWLAETQDQDPQVDEDATDIAVEWLKPLRRGLLASWTVGTVDQAMMAAMFIKYGVLRLLGLTGKVLILDEVHAFDVYMTEILKAVLEWCHELDIPVILLSATLPAEKKKELLSVYGLNHSESVYPGITYVRETGRIETRTLSEIIPRSPVTVRLHDYLHDDTRIAQLALDLVRDDGCVGVMVNTVSQAQEIYKKIIELQGNDQDVYLFHSRFPAARRNDIETDCIRAFAPTNKTGNRPDTRVKRGILVCTQVVEQSIDLDLDALITSAAPIDLVLQRLGRMHRHRTTNRPDMLKDPVLHVLVPEKEAWGADAQVYPDCLLQQSRRVLAGTDQITFPEDIPRLVEAGYGSAGVPEGELEKWLEHAFEGDMKKAQGHAITLASPDDGFEPVSNPPVYNDLEDRDYLSAQTRLGEPTVRIALLGKDLYEKLAREQTENNEVRVYDRDLAAAVMNQSVSVRISMLQDIKAPLSGAGLLNHVQIFPVENGIYHDPEKIYLYLTIISWG